MFVYMSLSLSLHKTTILFSVFVFILKLYLFLGATCEGSF